MKKCLVLGAGGFIGSHMVKRLKEEGAWVRGVDLKYPDFSMSAADEFVTGAFSNRAHSFHCQFSVVDWKRRE